MNLNDYLEGADNLYVQVLLTLVLILIYIVSVKLVSRVVRRYGRIHDIGLARVVYTSKYIRFVLFAIGLMILGIIWNISFSGLSVYFISFFTVAGIALFAAWSILSNITAAIILFFYFPYRIGDRIRIMDGDNSVEGIIINLNMFSIILENDERQKVTYPNNLALQKGIVLL